METEMNILIADDEKPAREELSFLLKDLMPEASLTTAQDGNDALNQLRDADFDVVFLDIEMPGKDGLQVATKLLERPSPPRIVFATAYSEHAVEAFRLSALDYLVKPVRQDRLEQTLDKLKETIDQRDGFQKLLWRRKAQKLWAESSDERWVLLDYDDILFIQAESKKVYASVDGYPPLRIRRTLKELEDELAGDSFLRVHKGYLVNLRKVKEMSTWFSGSYTLILDSKTKAQVPLSRRYVSRFREATGF
jgi:two-component system response regulator LytT